MKEKKSYQHPETATRQMVVSHPFTFSTFTIEDDKPIVGPVKDEDPEDDIDAKPGIIIRDIWEGWE